MTDTILSVENLDVSFQSYNGLIKAVRGVTFDLKKGETLAIVGESGSGKSVTAKSIMQLLPKKTTVINNGSIVYEGNDLLTYSKKEMEKIRGSEISMVFQDPMTSLNPTMKIGKQVMEGILKHKKISKKEAFVRAKELLELVGIPNAEERMKSYPHEFSGGMRQRVIIAMALASDPSVLIADEPTTALDVTIQAQILDLMKNIQKKTGTSILIITHDLGVVVNMAKRVAVMYAGQIVETGTLEEIFYDSKHPYTWGLMQSMPKLHQDRSVPLIPIAGSPPDVSKLHDGCPFAARCPYVMKVCHNHMPDQSTISGTHSVSCWLQDERAPHVEKPELGGNNVDKSKTS
ncbi:ATP-binding cassette domain-containing protein [Ornithinibacillus sp. L9]|uniref:ATP-binding cassette domain-containing protein n=1 Tax=Ornithinibacillus caprae TaxID=2678566 RepID=A0A6N8FE26_9BACI|nr:ABC transporter ATP-binding protein [Ornithinibacillus caprae]MUK87665.1 ATP-binding cassette domain-containing protein [Ornithinibacillus caprae]